MKEDNFAGATQGIREKLLGTSDASVQCSKNGIVQTKVKLTPSQPIFLISLIATWVQEFHTPAHCLSGALHAQQLWYTVIHC